MKRDNRFGLQGDILLQIAQIVGGKSECGQWELMLEGLAGAGLEEVLCKLLKKLDLILD